MNAKTLILKSIFVVALAMTTALTITFSAVSGQEATENLSSDSPNVPDRTIVGVWTTVVTQRNCQTGEPVAPPFQGLITFNEGGTMAEIGTNPAPPLRAPGHGIWEASNPFHPTFAFTFLRFNPDGTFAGRNVIRQTARAAQSGNDITASGTVQVLDPNGNVVGMGCATSVITRFQ